MPRLAYPAAYLESRVCGNGLHLRRDFGLEWIHLINRQFDGISEAEYLSVLPAEPRLLYVSRAEDAARQLMRVGERQKAVLDIDGTMFTVD